MYVSLDAPDRETYMAVCRPLGGLLGTGEGEPPLLGTRRSAVRITLVKGLNDFAPEKYAAILQDSGAPLWK